MSELEGTQGKLGQALHFAGHSYFHEVWTYLH